MIDVPIAPAPTATLPCVVMPLRAERHRYPGVRTSGGPRTWVRSGITTAGLTLVVVAACRSPSSSGVVSKTTDDETSGAGSSSSGTTGPLQAMCAASNECPSGEVCIAAYDPGTNTRGQGFCLSDCVEVADLSRWCVDDAACCGGLDCSGVDGFCLAPVRDSETSTEATQGSASSTTGEATDGDSTTATDTEASDSSSAGITSGEASGAHPLR